MSQKNSDTGLIFFGNEQIVSGYSPAESYVLKSLYDQGYKIHGAILSQNPSISRSNKSSAVEIFAKDHDIPVLVNPVKDEIADLIREKNVKLGVLIAYGRIIPQYILDCFDLGIINLHPSLLPKFRGSTPIESAILNGENKIGISLIKLVAKMDAGPVYIQKEVDIKSNMNKFEIARTILVEGTTLLTEILPEILTGSIKPTEQIEDNATYTQKLTKSMGVIEWNKPADLIEREVRAYLGWPGSRAIIAGREVIITEAHSAFDNQIATSVGSIEADLEHGYIKVGCKQGYLYIEKLKPAGKKEMSAKEFMLGYKIN